MRFLPALLAAAFLAATATPTLAAELDVQGIGATIPSEVKQQSGRVLSHQELVDLLTTGDTEIGLIVAASKRDFAATGTVYKLDYSLRNGEEFSGTLNYGDGALGRQGGHFILTANADPAGRRAGICRAPAEQDMTRRCYVVFEIGENLYEARANSSGLVRYRFRMVDVPALLAE